MFKSKISGTVQEVVLPDFPDEDNTVTTTVTKSRRVSFGTNFVKEFIVGSAVSAQCMSEYEQAFPSSDSSNADSSHSAAEIPIPDPSKFVMPESLKVHKLASTVNQSVEPESVENRPKPPKFSRTICFNADSPTADMEFTEGCITLAKSILDKKNKEMTVIIQAVPKETKEEEKPKEEETKYFDASQFEMSMTRCLKSKENKQEEKRCESEKTRIFSKFEDEMSITRCGKIFNDDESDSSLENCKENMIPLDIIMRHLDKDNSDLENDLFNPKKSLNNFLNASPLDFSNDSEKLNLNESMDISTDFHQNVFKESQNAPLSDDKPSENKSTGSEILDEIGSDVSMDISSDFQANVSKLDNSPFFETQKSGESEKICMDLQTDVLETPQNLIKSDEVVTFDKTTKSDHSETAFSNVLMEITSPVGKIIEISLQSEVRIIEGNLTDLKRADEVNSNESVEITAGLKSEQKSTQLSDAVNLSSFDEEMCNNKLADLNSFEKVPINESVNISIDFQQNILKVSEHLSQHDLNNDNELIKNKKLVEDLKFSMDAQLNVEASEQPQSENICNKNRVPNDFEKSTTHITETNASAGFETVPLSEQIIFDEPGGFNSAGKINSNISIKHDTNCRQQTDEKVPEVERNDFENLNENEEMDISTEKLDSYADTERPSSEEKITNGEEFSGLKKTNSGEDMEITADNEPNALEPLDKPQPAEAVTVDNSDKPTLYESIKVSADTEPDGLEIRQNSPSNDQMRKSVESNNYLDETDDVPTWKGEPSLIDVKMIESLKEQSKEPGCIWWLNDLRYPQVKTLGLLSFNCELLNSTTTINFYLKISNDDSLDSCSIIKNSEIDLNEEKQCRLPEYGLVIGFGFQQLKKFFEERRQNIETIRHIPFFLDQINSFLFKMNSYLRQIYSILTLYPGSRLKGSLISFRLYSFPIFFSCFVSIDLTDLFRLSKTSLSFENDFGTLDENKIREIFQKCLKNENSLCEFVVESTKYLVDLEKKTGYVSKRGHIRLLPVELKL